MKSQRFIQYNTFNDIQEKMNQSKGFRLSTYSQVSTDPNFSLYRTQFGTRILDQVEACVKRNLIKTTRCI